MRFSKIILAFFLVFVFVFCALPICAGSPDGKYVICIDAGHGGYDGGTDAGTKTEKEYNLSLSLYLRDALLADGRFEVVMTRDDDSYLKYLARADIARRANADLLISVHCNQVAESYVSGTQAYVSLIDRFNATALAGSILDNIESAVGIKRGKVATRTDSGDSLGVYYWDSERQWDMPAAAELGQVSDYYSMNTWSSKFGIPSIIVEHGFLSNANDLAVLNSDAKLKMLAEAEADAIIEYFTGHTHAFVRSVDYPSNCVMNGTISDRCSICGYKANTAPLPDDSEAHFWRTTSSKAATCTSDGEEHLVCQISFNLNAKGYDCDVHEKTEAIPALEHDYQTVTENGKLLRKCANCGDVTGSLCTGGGEHKYEINTDKSSPATCTADGVKTGTCSVCHATVTAVAAKTGHTYGDWVLTTPATCTTDGVETHTCSVCHATETRAVAKSGHNYSAWMTTTAPTCTAAGTQARVCEYCGDRQEQILPMVAHTYGEWAVSKPATCSAVGQEIRHCVNCSASETRTAEINPDAHTYGEWTVEVLRTCLADGLQKRVCKDCGKEETKVDACLGHQFGPTMMEGNVAAKMCSVCGYREEVETLKKGKMKTLTNSLASLVVSGATAEQELLFTFEDMPTDMATYYKQYLTFESAYVYSITSGSEALAMSEEMTLKLMLDDSLEDSAVSLTVLKDNSVYPVECSRKGQTLTIDGEAITGADAIFVIKSETEKSNLVLPLVIVGITVVGAGVALYFVLSNSKKKGTRFN